MHMRIKRTLFLEFIAIKMIPVQSNEVPHNSVYFDIRIIKYNLFRDEAKKS